MHSCRSVIKIAHAPQSAFTKASISSTFARTHFSRFLPCPASRPDYRIIRLVASGAELVTNQRPEGLFIHDESPTMSQLVLPVPQDNFEPMDCVWIFISSDCSIVDSLAGSRTRRYRTIVVRR